jgi:hypothetical protein
LWGDLNESKNFGTGLNVFNNIKLKRAYEFWFGGGHTMWGRY